jgi:hypothetical protein
MSLKYNNGHGKELPAFTWMPNQIGKSEKETHHAKY